MLFLPVFDRELRVASRSRRTYRARLGAAVAALVLAFYLIWLTRYALAGITAGMFILRATTYLAWGLCISGGVSRTGDAISAEKRSDTLGLLFLTRLSARDIVLGKLLANGLTSFYLLLAVLPILSVPVLLGGVAGVEIVRIPLALLNTLLLSLSTGLFVSSFVRSQKAATALSGGIILFLGVLLPLGAQLAERELENPELARWLRVPSPLCAQEMAFVTSFGLSTNDFWKSMFIQFSLALAALFGACRILPNSWQEGSQSRSFGVESWRAKLNQWALGSAAARLQWRTRLLNRNPWFWLCSRDRFAPLWPYVLLTTTFGVIGGCIVHYQIPQNPACILLFAGVVLNDLLFRMRVASVASYRLSEDRQSGALEMILSTALTVEDIVHGTWQAIRRMQFRAYCALFLAGLILAVVAVVQTDSRLENSTMAILYAIVSAGDFIVLGYVAMWKGMRAANPRQAGGLALLRVSLWPLILWLGWLPLIQEIPWLQGLFKAGEPYSYVLSGFFIWSISSVIALVRARSNLKTYFREAATDRYLLEQRFRFFKGGRSGAQAPRRAAAVLSPASNR